MLVRATVALASIATTITALILLLALRSAALLAVFFRILRFSRWFRIILGIFAFLPGIPFGRYNAFLCQLRLPIHLSLSLSSNVWPWGSALQPTFSGGFCCVCLGGITFCSSGAVSAFSSSCYGCCQLLLRLLGVFLLLVLVHLRFFHSVSCGWLPFWGSPSGYSFPNGRPYGKRSSSSYRPGGRRRFIGVRGVGSFFRTFGFPEVGAVSFPDLFRRLSVPPLAGLEGQGCGDLGCRGAAAGLLSALPQHSSSSVVPIPMPSSSPISITGAALEEVTLGLIAKGALELAPLPSPGFYSHLFVV